MKKYLATAAGFFAVSIAVLLLWQPAEEGPKKPMNIIVDKGYCGWFYIFNISDEDLPNYEFPKASPLNAVGRRGIAIRGSDWSGRSTLQFFEEDGNKPLYFKNRSYGSWGTEMPDGTTVKFSQQEYIIEGPEDCNAPKQGTLFDKQKFFWSSLP